MGVPVSKEAYRLRTLSRTIDAEIQRTKEANRSVLKLLLLGPGESGKSTVMKQMRLLHGDGFSSEDVEKHRVTIYANVLFFMQTIVQAMHDLRIPFASFDREVDAGVVRNAALDGREQRCLPPDVVLALKALWKDRGVQRCYARRSEYQLGDAAEYFFNQLDRLGSADYTPITEDILRAHALTTGVTEVQFLIQGVRFRLFDVGGQRSERKKWIHCFDDVKSIIFVASLSEFDQTLREDNRTNRMHESLLLFGSVCNTSWFREMAFILFLNKKDLFQTKLLQPQKSIVCVFPDYTGPNTYEACAEYIKQKYVAKNRMSERLIYCHFTCATDTRQLQFVLDSTIDLIAKKNCADLGV